MHLILFSLVKPREMSAAKPCHKARSVKEVLWQTLLYGSVGFLISIRIVLFLELDILWSVAPIDNSGTIKRTIAYRFAEVDMLGLSSLL